MKEASIYIHIPFCYHKCTYCDFYSIIKHTDINKYFKALELEIEYFAELYNKDYEFSTIYFGGGTPSLVNAGLISGILKKLNNSFKIKNDAEITIESNPGTLNQKKLEEIKAIGINRLSIGVQSFNEYDLNFLTRIHNRSDSLNAIDRAYKLGFDNISIDLMFSLPSQEKKEWIENLEMAVSLPISHISAYSLTLERGTALYYQVKKGQTQFHTIDHDADMYELTMDYLKDKGFEQYEVSNFAKDKKECKHNINYWSHINYLGFGTSSHSFWENIRWANYTALSIYLENINRKRYAIMREESLTPTDLYNERIFLSLRSKGLDLIKFEEEFQVKLYESEKKFFDELIEKNFIILKDNFIKFTSKGYLLCDEICQQLTI